MKNPGSLSVCLGPRATDDREEQREHPLCHSVSSVAPWLKKWKLKHYQNPGAESVSVLLKPATFMFPLFQGSLILQETGAPSHVELLSRCYLKARRQYLKN